jgi:ribonuclease P protein component
MLGAGQRMRRRDEFTSALRAGRRARRGELILHLSPGDPSRDGRVNTASVSDRRSGLDEARAGFVIPRTVGNAVVRNTVRRRLRHLLRDRLAALPDGSLLVVRVLPGGGECPYAELSDDLDAALAALTRAPAAQMTQPSHTAASSPETSSGQVIR